MNKQSGLTLIEVMVVVVILGILATMIVPQVIGQKDQALKTAAQTQISQIVQQLHIYNLQNNNYPSTDEGLQALVNAEGNIGYEVLPKDPWGNEYHYLYPGQHHPKTKFDVWSYGADGREGGEGVDADIGNWHLKQ